MAPHKPHRYAGPVAQQDQLSTALQSAKPDWSARELALATDKLSKIGVDSIEELVQALAEGLNAKIRTAGLKTFGSETISEFKKVLNAKYSILVSQQQLEEVRTRKQAAVAECNFLEAGLLRRREVELQAEVEELVPGQEPAADEKRKSLEEELQRVQTLKKLATKAEDYEGAGTLKQREAALLVRLQTFKEPGVRVQEQLRALKKSLARVTSEIAAAVEAEEYELAHAARERQERLREQLSGLQAECSEVCGALEEAELGDPASADEHPSTRPARSGPTTARQEAEDTDAARDPQRERPGDVSCEVEVGEGPATGSAAVGRASVGRGSPQAGSAAGRRAGLETGMRAELAIEAAAEVRRPAAQNQQPAQGLQRPGHGPGGSRPRSSDTGEQQIVEVLQQDCEVEGEEEDEVELESEGQANHDEPLALDGASGGDHAEDVMDHDLVTTWTVVAGQGMKNNLNVFRHRSQMMPLTQRLAVGAELKEIEVIGDWLHFAKLTGTGPDEGWVRVRSEHKVFVRCPDSQQTSDTLLALPSTVADPPDEATTAATGPVTTVLSTEVHLPQADLEAAMDTPEDQAATPAPMAVQVDESVRRQAELAGIQVDQLRDPSRAAATVARIERLNRTTAKRLGAECTQLGIAWDENMSRAQLANLARDAILWEELNTTALLQICREQGLEVEGEGGLERQDLLEMLKSASWEAQGVPICRLEGPRAAQQLLEQQRELEQLGEMDLALKCAEQGLPTADVAGMRQYLRRSFLWGLLPLPELRRECTFYGLPSEGEASELLESLAQGLGRDRWQARGVPMNRLGRERADEVLAHLERLQNRSLTALRAECRQQGLSVDPSADAQSLLEDLRMYLVWRHLPDEEFREECLEHDVPVTSQRRAVLPRLLERHKARRRWLAQGIPAVLCQDSDLAEELSAQLQHTETMSDEDLQAWYIDSMAEPWERDIKREELVELSKLVCISEALPLEELARRCEASGIDISGDGNDKDTMLDRLLERAVEEAWERRGYEALRIKNHGILRQMVETNERFLGMDDEELKSSCVEYGISLDSSAGRADYLRGLKQMMIWEGLPINELHVECSKLGLPTKPREEGQPETDEERNELIQQLSMGSLRKDFEDRGLSLAAVSAEQAFDLVMQFQRLGSLTLEELRGLQQELIPLPEDASREELIRCFQEWTYLLSLPFKELALAGHKFGVPITGFDVGESRASEAAEEDNCEGQGESAPGSKAEAEDQLRIRLQSRVFLRRRHLVEPGPGEQLPQVLVAPGGSMQVRQLPRVWEHIRQMRDPFVAEVICNVPGSSMPSDVRLPAAAREWRPLDAALHVLSDGLFNPKTCKRNTKEYTPAEERKLISVICPTSSSRKIWHNLFYECFQAQTYEPKELIIVDTGVSPSNMFQDIAKDDPRVVYNFFPVSDTKDPRDTGKSKSWSLGLKRNIACSIARGSVIAQFDDDDLYFPSYLEWFWPRITEAAGESNGDLGPALAKLSQWHLFDLHNMAFHLMNPLSNKSMPLHEQPAALYGWGFSYVFTRAAWEAAPFPDVHFAEDAGFVEGLLARGFPVSLLALPDDCTLVAHTVHPSSTTGGEVTDGQKGCNNPVETPKEFEGLFQKLTKQVLSKAKSRNMFTLAPGGSKGRDSEAQPPSRRAGGPAS